MRAARAEVRWPGWLAVALSLSLLGAEAKPIRLRHALLLPPENRPQAAFVQSPDSTALSGLFLIQFTGPPRPEWRQELEALGVRLLRYVPEDTFVADLENVPPGRVRRLDYVTWVGPYQPEHKVHRTLASATAPAAPAVSGPPAAAAELEVSVLLAPRAKPADVAAARGLLHSVVQETRLRSGTVLRGRVAASRLTVLAQSRAVLWIEPAPRMRLFDEVSSKLVAGDGGPRRLYTQTLGYDGSGVTVAVADSGLDSGDTNAMHPDIQGRVRALFAYGGLADAADEHSHGTHCAGIIAGNGALGETDPNGRLYGLGVAPGVALIGQRIFDAQGGYAPPASFEALTRDATRAGAEVGSNSWGDDTQGRYDLSAMEFDELVRDADALALGDQPYILEFSAGNAGPGRQTIGSPAVAKNVIATGAANSDRRDLPIEEFTIYDQGPETMADFSSRGPCEDGRIKPDLVAPGTWIASLRSVFANDEYAWWPISQNYMYQGGTSQAGPHVAGAAAVFVQYYRATHGGLTPSPALVKAALINAAADMDDAAGTPPVPNMDEGWGRVDLPALLDGSRSYEFLDQTVLLTNGGVFEQHLLVGSGDAPLKVTLAYTDVPGNPAAVVALVNDLDLEVLAPDGRLYRGNLFADGESVPDGAVSDTVNNVEAVHLFSPVPGEYTVRVRARRVVEDARQETPAVDQDFALVTSADFAAPGVGVVTLDREAYRAPDFIRLTLVDYDLAGQATVEVRVRSGIEPGGEPVTLRAQTGYGLFTGTLAVATGPALPDGALQVVHGTPIEALYNDASPQAERTARAVADLVPPVISGVRATNLFGQVRITWQTDEATLGVLYYGTNAPTASLTNRGPDTAHEFVLPALPPGAVVRFYATALDRAGNGATNDNGGLFFTVTNTQPPTVLLIDSYTDSYGLVAPPPLSGYTDALDALGVGYEVFDARFGDEPTPQQLGAFECVIWRMDEISVPTPSLPQKLAAYVNSGGSLLVASMEGVTRLTEAGLGGLVTSLFQIQSYTEDQPVDWITGVAGEPLGAGIDTALDYAPYDELLALLAFFGVTDPSDWIVPGTNATAILTSGGAVVGVRAPRTGVDLPGRVVYLSFPLDAVPLGQSPGNNRLGLLRNALDFLAPPRGTAALQLDSDVYSVPGRATVEVEDADLRDAGAVTVRFSSGHAPQPVEVTLAETTRRGLFRGSVVFVPSNTGAPGTLWAQAGDMVEADYLDASSGRTLRATALIETDPPAITNVAFEPGYLEAIVRWATSEPADSLVQYSESPDTFPNNWTAYDPMLREDHQIFLSGLKPNRTYYVRLASRDRAGNVTTDDNGGSFYTFTTLQPLLPPYTDNFEGSVAGWSTYAPEESETDWTCGAPGGGESAHSPTRCWGSNLDGGPLGQAECYLISPGILLAGGNRATLRFWHNYDLLPRSDFDIELAAVEIITNILAAPVPLWQLPADASFGWEEVELDLTPYLGNVVYLVWYYFLFSFESPPRPGWLVDDVAVTVSTVVPGTIEITNNIWQAVFALSGPTGLTARGRSLVLSNAPPGDYRVEFGDAPGYQTPVAQSGTLGQGGFIRFEGVYTFADSNTNGIPDSLETAWFGGVDPLRSATTDSDGDGLSDRAEFVAGTNPTNAASVLALAAQVLADGHTVKLQWPGGVGHGYRLLSSTNGVHWAPFTDWLRASNAVTELNLPPQTNGGPHLFRLEAQP